MKSPIILLRALLADVKRLEPDVKGLERDILTLEQRFEHEGYGFLAVALPSLCEALVQGLATGRFACPLGFKTTKGETIPRLFSGMFCMVFDPSSGHLKDPKLGNFGVIKLLREILNLFKKTQLSDSTTELLDAKAKAEFFENDELIKPLVLESSYAHHLDRVCAFLMPSLCVRDFGNIECKHGPGAVAEGYKANQKWSALIEAIRNDSVDVDTYGLCSMATVLHLEEFNSSPRRSDHSSYVDVALSNDDGASSRTARLVSVPKNSTSARTITVEPLVNQYVQQGLNILLRSSIERCGILSQCLALTDQTKNQILALEGSLTDRWATIDLKSASDLLSLSLVEAVFRHHGPFLKAMVGCRSSFVSLDNCPRPIKKFAGMGNALTFPVQSIVFATVAIAAILHSQGKKPDYRGAKRAARYIRVYGDDIIVDTRYARTVVDRLQEVGLKVNLKKSFLGGNFKESCGCDAYMGVDITPVYLRVRPDDSSTDANIIASLVSTSNQAWLRGLYSFSAHLKNEVEERLKKRLPLVSQESGMLGWHTHLDAMEPHRWNHVLHRLETRTYGLVSLKRKDPIDGYSALLKFFHVPLIGRVKDHLEKTTVRFKNKLKAVYVPTQVGRRRHGLVPYFVDEGA